MAQCSTKVYPRERYGSLNGYQCSRKSVVERDGKPFCKMHDPELRREKAAKQHSEWKAKWEAADAKAARDSAILKACEGMDVEQVIHAIKNL